MAISKIKLEELKSIDYTKISLGDVKQELIDYIKNDPTYSTKWDNFYDSDSGKMILDTWAYLYRKALLRMDILANENYPSTAQQDSSVIKVFKLIGYELRSSSQSKVYINVEYPDGRPAAAIDLGIGYALPGRDTTGNSVNFYVRNDETDYFSPITIPVDIDGKAKRGIILRAYSGEAHSKVFDRDGILTKDSEVYVLDDYPINQGTVRSFYYDPSDPVATRTEAIQVDSFFNVASTATYVPFIVHYDENHGVYLEFGDSDLVEVLPDGWTLETYYTINGGSNYNIIENSINVGDTFLANSLSYSGPVSVIFNNPGKGFGGKDPETIAEAKLTAPLTLRTIDRTVTEQDYEILLARQGLILHSKALSPNDNRDYFPSDSEIPLFHMWLYITLNRSVTNVTDLLLTKQVDLYGTLIGGDAYDILTYLEVRKIVGIENILKPTIFTRLFFALNIIYNKFVDETIIEEEIRTKLDDLFNIKNTGYQKTIRINVIIANLKSVDGVIDVVFSTFKRKTYIQLLDTVASNYYFKFVTNNPTYITVQDVNLKPKDYTCAYNEVAFLLNNQTDVELNFTGIEEA